MGEKLSDYDKQQLARLKKKVVANQKSLKSAHDKLQKLTEQKTKKLEQMVEELKTLGDAITGLSAKHKTILDRQEQQIKGLG